MPYTKTSWVDGSAPAISASNLNKIEQGIADSFRTDGTTTMSGQMVVIAGSATTPSIAQSGDSNNGIFFPLADTVAISTSGTEKMRIDSTGRVGIGTTPTVPLHVYSASGDAQILSETNATGGTSRIQIKSNGAGGGNWYFMTGDTTSTLNGRLRIWDSVAGAERITILPTTGEVGIGTINPSAPLTVFKSKLDAGVIPIVSYQGALGTGTSGHSIEFKQHTTYTTGFITCQATGGGGGTDLIFGTTASYGTADATEKMRIDRNGNVGIGLNNPSNKIHLYQANTNQQYISISNLTSTILFGQDTSGNPTTYTNQNVDFVWANGGTTKMRLDSSGRLGIGVAPNVSLHAKSSGEIFRLETTAATGDCFMRFYAPSVTTKGFFGFLSAASDNFYLSNEHNASILFRTNGTERLVIENAGTVRPYANNAYELGSASYRWSTIYSQNVLNVSDARLKTDVQDSTLGLHFISNLRPVQYKFIEGRNEVTTDENGEQVITKIPGVRTHFGLIAQEVKDAIPTGLDFAGWCLADKNDETSTQSLGYTELIAPMIKAIQELTAKVEALEAQLKA